jgi:hypothetical protein
MTDTTTGGYDFGGSPFTGGYDGGCGSGCGTDSEVQGGSMVTSFLSGNVFDGVVEAAIIAYFILLSMSLWIWGNDIEQGMWAVAGVVICGAYFLKEFMNGQLYLARLFPVMGVVGGPVAPLGVRG